MKTFLVGGAVRNALLNLPVKDKDWVVVGATPQALLDQGYQQVGHDFPVFLHPTSREEYALARTERKKGTGYTGFETRSSPYVTLEQDLQRRDLTINAIACDEHGQLFDPYQGQRDIANRQLRHVSKAFIEDPLRVLRVARFAAYFAHLNFRIADETQALMRQITASGELFALTAERIWKESEKALSTPNPQIYFQVLRDCGALRILFPEIDNLFGIPAPEKWHPEIDTGIHTLMTLTVAASLSSSIEVRFAALLHDVGKALTPLEKLPSHTGHGLAGIPIVKALCHRLHVPNEVRDLAVLVAKFHDTIHTIEKQPGEVLVSLFDQIDAWRKPQRVDQLARCSEADARGRGGQASSPYPQADYLRRAFSLAQTVPIKLVLESGFKGIDIRKELTRRRLIAVTQGITSIT